MKVTQRTLKAAQETLAVCIWRSVADTQRLYGWLSSPEARYVYRKVWQLLGILWAVLVYLYLCGVVFGQGAIEGYREGSLDPLAITSVTPETPEGEPVEDPWVLPAAPENREVPTLSEIRQEVTRLTLVYSIDSVKPIALLPAAKVKARKSTRKPTASRKNSSAT